MTLAREVAEVLGLYRYEVNDAPHGGVFIQGKQEDVEQVVQPMRERGYRVWWSGALLHD